MGGFGSVDAEITGSADDPSTEVILPESINNHTSRERILRAGNPIGQSETTLLVGSVGLNGSFAEQRDELRTDFFLGLFRIATV